jgi:hypothetical protein
VLANPGSREAMQPIQVAGWSVAHWVATTRVGRTAAVGFWAL